MRDGGKKERKDSEVREEGEGGRCGRKVREEGEVREKSKTHQ